MSEKRARPRRARLREGRPTVIFRHQTPVRNPATGQLIDAGRSEVLVFPVFTVYENHKWRTMSSETRSEWLDKYGLTGNKVMAMVSGGSNAQDFYGRYLCQKYAYTHGFIPAMPEVEVFSDKNYKAWFDWWKSVIAHGDRVTVDDFNIWQWEEKKTDAPKVWALLHELGFVERIPRFQYVTKP